MVIKLLLTGCLMLTGCATKTMVTAACPEPPVTARPRLSVLELKLGDSPDSVLRSHRTDIKALQGYAIELETLLDAYRKEPTVEVESTSNPTHNLNPTHTHTLNQDKSKRPPEHKRRQR